MVGTQTKLKYEQACDLFGDDIGELVASLLIMDEPQSLHRRKFLSHHSKIDLSILDKWILTNIGLPEWVSPHLNVKLSYCNEIQKLVIAEYDEEFVFIEQGKVFLGNKHTKILLNSNLINFLKSIFIYNIMIEQAILIFGSEAFVNKQIPAFLSDCFINLLKYIDESTVDTWVELTELN